MTFYQTNDSKFGTAEWIVSANISDGATHTTIAAALTAASSGDTIFIRPGTYTENLTLKAGVSITGYPCDTSITNAGNVIISGTCTLTTAGTVSISGVTLQTNSAAFLAVTGSAASIVNLIGCNLNCTNNTGITFSSSSSSARVLIAYCFGNLGTTGIALFSHSSAGAMSLRYTLIDNTGSSTTANTCSAGTFNMFHSFIGNPLTYSGTGNGLIKWCEIAIASGSNATVLTTVAGQNNEIFYTRLSSGTSTPYSCGGTDTVNALTLHHTNATAITGAGTLTYTNIMQTSTVGAISAGTLTPKFTSGAQNSTTPPAGYIGERIVNNRSSASALSLTNNTLADNTSISLTAGVWDVSCITAITSSGTCTQKLAGISPNSASLTGAVDGDSYAYDTAIGSTNFIIVPAVRVSVASTTTYYNVVRAQFTTGAASAYGRMSAVRVA